MSPEPMTASSVVNFRRTVRARAPAPGISRLGQPDEIADFVVFLLPDRSGVVTGPVIDRDQIVLGDSD